MAKFRLTKNNYYSKEANQHYWSASFVKSLLNCPESAIAQFLGDYEKEPSTALLVGSYVDAAFEGKKSLNDFKESHPDIFNKRTGELKAEYRQADEMVARAKRDKVFSEYMKGQKQKIFTGTIAGIPFKAKLDVYRNGERIVDLKTAKDLHPAYFDGIGRVHPVIGWRWDLQMAIYQELVRQNTGNKLPCYLAVITKENPPDISILELPQSLLDSSMEYLENQLPRLDAMVTGTIPAERCDECEYCRETKVLDGPETFDFMLDGGLD